MTARFRTWIVAYDVTDEKRRRRLASWLAEHGERVNWSVFEIRWRNDADEDLLAALLDLVDTSDDHVRLYPLDRDALDRSREIGRPRKNASEVVFV